MVISSKDAIKFIGVSIMICCAVFVCNLFLNYSVDMSSIESLIEGEQMRIAYDAITTSNLVVCLVSGGCLVATTIVILVFYVSLYIAKHANGLGVLKALGYSDWEIARCFALFGLSVFIGAAVGLGGSWILMPSFYEQQAANHILPDVILHFNVQVFLTLLMLPTAFFGALSVLIAYYKLKQPVINLLKGKSGKPVKVKEKRGKERSFLFNVSASVFRQRKSLVFFVGFGGFCVAAMIQMGLSMEDYASGMMGAIMIIIGLVLAATSLFLALTTVVGGNAKTVAMLKVFGYNKKENFLAVLGLYHIPSYVGFALGSVYQWVLLNVMVNIVFRNYDNITAYRFDWAVFGYCLLGYVIVYELLNFVYSYVIQKTPLKVVMGE